MGYNAILLTELNLNMITTLWDKIELYIKAGVIDVNQALLNLKKVVEVTDNVLVTPLLAQIAKKNLTYITCILDAVSKIQTFKWAGFFAKYPLMNAQFTTVLELAPEIAKNPYIGLEVFGVGTEVKDLAYFCTQFLIKMGVTTLNQYRGVGKTGFGVMGTKTWDSLIDEHMDKKTDVTADYEEIENSTAELSDSQKTRISLFYQDMDEVDTVEIPAFFPPPPPVLEPQVGQKRTYAQTSYSDPQSSGDTTPQPSKKILPRPTQLELPPPPRVPDYPGKTESEQMLYEDLIGRVHAGSKELDALELPYIITQHSRSILLVIGLLFGTVKLGARVAIPIQLVPLFSARHPEHMQFIENHFEITKTQSRAIATALKKEETARKVKLRCLKHPVVSLFVSLFKLFL